MYVYILRGGIFDVYLYGYFSPPVVVFTIFTNTLTCIVLLKKHMRNPTNIILLSIALLDMFTGISCLPGDMYYYTLGYYKEYVPYNLCWITHLTQDVVPRVLHTASIWITVLLALQRYICVCHPLVGNRWCTMPKTINCIIVICIFALLIHILNNIKIDFTLMEIPSLLNPTKNITGCTIIRNYTNALHSTNLWTVVIFVKLIPCFSLLILNSLLLKTMHRAAKRRRMLLSQNRTTESRSLSESNRTTMLLVMVVGLFLMVELPNGVNYIIFIVQNKYNVFVVTLETHHVLITFTNFFILLSFPFNLLIYCGMSRQFRETFKRLFTHAETTNTKSLTCT